MKPLFEFLKKQWSRKLIIGLYIWHVITAIFLFTEKIPAAEYISATLWIFGVMVLGSGIDKAAEHFNKPKTLFDANAGDPGKGAQ